MAMILYGISNCDTVKKARRWLDEQGVAYRFHDVRKDGLDAARLQGWVDMECGRADGPAGMHSQTAT